MQSMKELPILVLLLELGVNGAILPCKDSVESKLCLKVNKIDDYITTISPEPIPTLINITITVHDVFDVNEDKKTVTLNMKIILEWFDFRLDVKRSQKEIEK